MVTKAPIVSCDTGDGFRKENRIHVSETEEKTISGWKLEETSVVADT